MSGYQPIYRSILDSSIARDHVVRHVFEDLLKLADFRTAIVDMTHEAIARRTNVPEEMVRHAITELEKPDPESRNKAEAGRRIVRLDAERPWGWRIVNFLQYREEIRLDGKRRRQAEYRDRKRGGKKGRPGRPKKPVTEAASRGDAERRGVGSEKPVTEGKREKGKGRSKNEEEQYNKPPSGTTGSTRTRPPLRGGSREFFDRLRKEARKARTEEFFDDFMTDERSRFARDLMEERPAVFDAVSIANVEDLWSGGVLRGTRHDRRAVLLWARNPDGFRKGERDYGPPPDDDPEPTP